MLNRQEKQSLVGGKRALNESEAELRQLQQNCVHARQSIERHRRENRGLKEDWQRAEDAAKRLQDELEEQVPQEGLIENLQVSLDEVKQENTVAEGAFQDSINAKDVLNEEQNVLKAEMQARQAEVDEYKAQKRKAEGKVKKLDDERVRALQNKNEAMARINDAKAEKADRDEARKAQEDKVEEFGNSARGVSERVAVPRGETVKSLEKKFERIQKEIDQAEQE